MKQVSFFSLLRTLEVYRYEHTIQGLQKNMPVCSPLEKSELQRIINQFEKMYIFVSFWKTIAFLVNLVAGILRSWKISENILGQGIPV